MAYCRQCGAELRNDAQFCTCCGTPVNPIAQQPQPQPQQTCKMNYSSVDPEMQFDPQDVQKNKVMAILAYFGILVVVPLFAAKESKFARFHANQGLVLLICDAAYSVGYGILSSILDHFAHNLSFATLLLGVIPLVLFVFSILGIINAASGKATKLPVVGDFRILK